MSDQLAAIDDALETGAADHVDPLTRELQELALALRADAPEPDPGFQQELRRRVEHGFPKPASSRRPLWRRVVTPVFATVLLAAPIVLIALLAGGSGGSDLDSSGSSGGGSADAGASTPAVIAPEASTKRQQFERAADQAAGSSAPDVAIPPGGGFAPGQRNRKIERSIGLELEMPVDQMARVAEQVTTVTNRYGGFVLNSSLTTGGDSPGGDFELRIPSARLRPALRDLSGLADVRTQNQSGRDVTREHVTTKDRLQAARAERRSLLRRLELATTDAEAEAIRRRLDLVAGEISGLRGQLRGLHLRTDYAVVTVSLLPKDGDQGGGAGGSFDDALGDAGDLLVGVAGVIIRVLAVALPLGLIALVGWLAGRAFTRRRRESALA
ncbi:MAG TPA: DUF4349 domain-containing protein [Thermoleophilaceae bacterium]|nr:DUF4349 domain-containing protein [Thermoleophilaceae bacterium]